MTSGPALTLSAAAARAATPQTVRNFFRHRRSVPIIRPRLGAISARLRSTQVRYMPPFLSYIIALLNSSYAVSN